MTLTPNYMDKAGWPKLICVHYPNCVEATFQPHQIQKFVHPKSKDTSKPDEFAVGTQIRIGDGLIWWIVRRIQDDNFNKRHLWIEAS